jgi:hypothetical protein
MRVWGVRTTWQTVEDGDFFCAGCGGDRNYRRRTGRRSFTVLGLPILPRGAASPIVECSSCRARFGTHVLNTPTTTRFSAMLRDAVHTVALAVLAAGGAEDHTVQETVVGVLRGAGLESRTAEQLLTLIRGLTVGTGRLPGSSGDGTAGGTVLVIELHKALEPLAPHLAPAGREAILLQGARIALADGPYSPAERETLAAVGRALLIGHEDTERLLAAAARTPS